MRRALAVCGVTLFLLTIAGCNGPGAAPAPSPSDTVDPHLHWSEDALAYGGGHDHTNATHHQNLSTPNFEIVGYDPLVSEATGRTNGGHFCGDAQPTPDGRRIAAVESRNVGGFVVADVTDPAAPEYLGEFIMPQSRVYDLAVVPDGRNVLLVTTPMTPPSPLGGPPPPPVWWRSACAEEPVPLTSLGQDNVPRDSSLILVSIADPHAPTVVDQRPIAVEGHSVYSTIIDGRTWVLATVISPTSWHYQFYEIVTAAGQSRLNYLSTYAFPPPADGSLELVSGHDGWIAKHPGTGQTLAYLAGGLELHVLDLADPLRPQLLSRWSDYSAARAGSTGSLHSVTPMTQMWGDQHYTLLGPEFGSHPSDQPSGTVWLLDTTDPAAPFEVGAWTLPHDVEWTGEYMFSNHYFTIHNQTAFVSMYHGGVWAIDLSDATPENYTLFPSVGVFLPDRASPHPPLEITRWTPTVEDVIAFEDGSIVVFDGNSGVYVVRYDEARPMKPPEPWPVPAVA